jgi:NTE family protein
MDTTVNTIGLSLSGGGYRATAFHLGTLNKLNNMGVLPHVNVLSTISGGSITGAYYCLHKDDYPAFSKSLYEAVQQKNVVKKVLLSGTFLQLVLFTLAFIGTGIYFLFTCYAWLFPVLLIAFFILLFKFQFSIFPVSKRIEHIYNAFFYSGKALSDLPEQPKLVIGSTNLQTSRPFTFSKDWMQDSSYQYLRPPIEFETANFPIARAVMASTCVPFAFTPITIDKAFFKNPADADKIHPLLVDGGVYDNQGIHKIMQGGRYNCTHVITSDAGCGSSGELTIKNTVSLLMATVDTFMSRIKKAQMAEDVFDNAATFKKQIAYFSLGWDVENCIPGFIKNLEKKQITQSVIDALQLPAEWVVDPRKFKSELQTYLEEKTNYTSLVKPTEEEKKIARNVGTNLTALSKLQVDCLMKQAECLAELQVKLYCPSLIK